MTATALPYVVIPTAALLVLAALGTPGWTFLAGRVRDRRASWTDLTLYRPPPVTQADVDATWLDVWPTCEEAEQAVYDGLFRAIPEVAADLRKSGAA